MSDKSLQEISNKLDQLILLSAVNAVKGMKQTPAIILLGGIGLDRNLIAQAVGTTPGTVSVRLSEAKSKKSAAPEKKTATAPVSDQSDTEEPER